jgi:hypothetical protein
MDSITTMTARQCRLQEWMEQIKSCKNRPQGTSVEEWCSLQGITKTNYYYRLRRVRMACLQEISKNNSDSAQVMAQVPEHLLEKSMASSEIKPGTLTIQIRDCSIQVTSNSSLELLSSVLHVIRHAE